METTKDMHGKRISDRLLAGEASLAVVGLGYVGLPAALAFAEQMPVIGYDCNREKVKELQLGRDPNGEEDAAAFAGRRIRFSSDESVLDGASFYVVAVPTPIDGANHPDLAPLLGATETVARHLAPGDYVVYESTVYPGCTREDCVPLLESVSGLKAGVDFQVGYSPERINPGDREHTLANTVKVVSGWDAESLEEIARVYGTVVRAGVFRASSLEVAEAAKIIENTQRDVNIALMNELSILFSRIGINTYEVLEAAGTKWNFLRFAPGLVGGHCIGVDPYYLVHKASQLKYHTQIIRAGRFVNDSMGGYIAKKTVKELIHSGKSPLNARVLVMGFTFKEGVSDIRNTKVADIVRELQDYGVCVDVTDPYADSGAVSREYGFSLVAKPGTGYDAVVVAVAHEEYRRMDPSAFGALCRPDGILVDVKGIYRHAVPSLGLRYWSL